MIPLPEANMNEDKISNEEMIMVGFDADEMYPALVITRDWRPDTEVPAALVAAVDDAWDQVAVAEKALLEWLRARDPEHPIFRYFPPPLAASASEGDTQT